MAPAELIDFAQELADGSTPPMENDDPYESLKNKLRVNKHGRVTNGDLKDKNHDGLTKDQALNLAIEAAELQMKFLKLSESGLQQKSMKTKSNQLLTQAENIKKARTWEPLSGKLMLDIEPLQPSRRSSTAQTPASKGSPTLVSSEINSTKPSSVHAVRPSVPSRNGPVPPVSERKLNQTETLILYQGGNLNNSKSPIWVNEPSINEFSRTYERNFLDNCKIRLSDAQRKILDDWKRPTEALPPPQLKKNSKGPLFERLEDSAGAIDLIVTSILFPHDPSDGTLMLSENGKYIVKLNFNGCERRVVIDDRLPVSKSDRILHIIDRHNSTLLWPALLEKAYLKVRGGYDFPGSNSGTDLWVLTGWIPEQIILQHEDTNLEHLWSRMLTAHKNGDVLITAGTGRMSARSEKEIGLAGEHDYAILKLTFSGGRNKLLVKNPWLSGPIWKGGASIDGKDDDSSQKENMTPHEADAKSPIPSHDPEEESKLAGRFWMTMNELAQNFHTIYLNWNPVLFKHRQDTHFTWNLKVDSTSGRSPIGSFNTNPQHVINCEQSGQVWILLSRHFRDRPTESDPAPLDEADEYISLYGFENGGKRTNVARGAFRQGPFLDSPQTLFRLEANRRTPYTIVTAEQGLSSTIHNFTISAFSSAPLTLSEATPKYSDRTHVKGKWTRATSGGNATKATYCQNPQFNLTLPESSPVCLILEMYTEGLSVQLKLVRSKGERLTTITKGDVIIDSGNYRKGIAVAEIPTELDKGKYTIVAATYEPGQLGDFKLFVDSNTTATLNPVQREGAGRLIMRLAEGSFGYGIRRIGAPITPMRLSRMYFNAYPVKPGGGGDGPDPTMTLLRSPIRLTIERGHGPQRQILIASANGSYSDAPSGVKTDDIDLNPRMLYKDGSTDMWMVLERMGGFGEKGKPEERVRVEVFADTEWPITTGVWRDMDASSGFT
ncbi:MAG: cysteine protease [Alyxoria varia]|nr:MAG: cysteine protease [Alyxoria varia]